MEVTMRLRVLRAHLGDDGMLLPEHVFEAAPPRAMALISRGLVEALPDASAPTAEPMPIPAEEKPSIVLGGSRPTRTEFLVCPECGSKCRDEKTFAAHQRRAHTFQGARGK